MRFNPLLIGVHAWESLTQNAYQRFGPSVINNLRVSIPFWSGYPTMFFNRLSVPNFESASIALRHQNKHDAPEEELLFLNSRDRYEAFSKTY